MPEGAAYVGRPTRWGNPFVVGKQITDSLYVYASVGGVPLARDGVVEDPEHAVELFAFWLMAKVPFTEMEVRVALAGKNLACWCPLEDDAGAPVPCHADVLLEIANGSAS